MLAAVCLAIATVNGHVVASHRPLLRSRASTIAMDDVKSWYDRGIRLDGARGSRDLYAAPPAPPPPPRESAEEAWASAEEGKFMSPALAAGLIFVGLAVKTFVFGGQSPVSF